MFTNIFPCTLLEPFVVHVIFKQKITDSMTQRHSINPATLQVLVAGVNLHCLKISLILSDFYSRVRSKSSTLNLTEWVVLPSDNPHKQKS